MLVFWGVDMLRKIDEIRAGESSPFRRPADEYVVALPNDVTLFINFLDFSQGVIKYFYNIPCIFVHTTHFFHSNQCNIYVSLGMASQSINPTVIVAWIRHIRLEAYMAHHWLCHIFSNNLSNVGPSLVRSHILFNNLANVGPTVVWRENAHFQQPCQLVSIRCNLASRLTGTLSRCKPNNAKADLYFRL